MRVTAGWGDPERCRAWQGRVRPGVLVGSAVLTAPTGGRHGVVASQANAARRRVNARASCLAHAQVRSSRRRVVRPLRVRRAAMWRMQ